MMRDLRVDLGLALAHGEVAPDARMGLGGVSVELRHGGDGSPRGGLVRARHEGSGMKACGSKPLKPSGTHAPRAGGRHHLAAEGDR